MCSQHLISSIDQSSSALNNTTFVQLLPVPSLFHGMLNEIFMKLFCTSFSAFNKSCASNKIKIRADRENLAVLSEFKNFRNESAKEECIKKLEVDKILYSF